MAVYQVNEPTVEPVSLEEVKNHLRLNKDFTDDDTLLETLITMARMDAEAKTGGRVFPAREWEWMPEGELSAATCYEVPVSPALNIKIFNLDDGSEIDSNNYRFVKSSLSPHGRPLYAKLTPLTNLSNIRILIEAGWPNLTEERVRTYLTPPTFKPELTTYTENSVTLQFDREVRGEANVQSFTLIADGDFVDIHDVDVVNGRITLHTASSLFEDSKIELSYVSGFLKDKDDNYVMPIMKEVLPNVEYGGAIVPIPVAGTEEVKVSTVPGIVKSWILVRVSTLYQQRSEIAIQAGKTSNAFFPRPFINGMLDAYTIEKA